MALRFNGSSHKLDYGVPTGYRGASVFSLAFWLRVGTLTANRPLISFGDSTDAAADVTFECRLHPTNETRLECNIGDGNQGRTPADTLANGVWSHAVWIFDGAGAGNAQRLRCYVNGLGVNLSFNGTIPTTAGSTAGKLWFGFSHYTGLFCPADTDIAHFQGYPGLALDRQQALALFAASRPIVAGAAVVGPWLPFDDAGLGTDYSGNAYTPTFVGSPAQVSGPPVSGGAACAPVI
jgi:hypothetical protein